MTAERDRVVVTGIGATTPLGGDASTSWAALLAGRSGVSQLSQEWAKTLPVQIAGVAARDPSSELDRVQARRLDRSQQLALVASREAWSDAGLGTFAEPTRLAVAVASGIGGVITLLSNYDALNEHGAQRVSPLAVTMLMPNGAASAVGLEFGAQAGVHSPVSACASGAEAIALGLDLIRAGRADVAICGGTEAGVHPLPLAGFAAMRALSTRNDEPEAASRPYDKGRDGFVLGEGAGVLILESRSHALARKAPIYAELAGAGITSDAFHVAAPDPAGAGAGRAITMALRDAGAVPGDVAHVNAHATGTPVGDVAEAAALRRALGAATPGVAVSATKAATGHLLGAAGAVEAVFTVQALAAGIAPPNRNLDSIDDEVDLDVVGFEPRALPDTGIALSTSFGFGGHNVALVFRGGA